MVSNSAIIQKPRNFVNILRHINAQTIEVMYGYSYLIITHLLDGVNSSAVRRYSGGT